MQARHGDVPKNKDGTLWRLPTRNGQQFQLVVPFILRDDILDDLHAGMVGGHMGEEIGASITGTFLLARMCRACKRMVQNMSQMCHQKDRWSKEDSRTEDHTHWYPMQVVAVDIMGPLPTTSDGNRYVLCSRGLLH